MKILIVDDNPDNLDLATQILEESYTILTASNGFDCLSLSEKEQPDLILLDVMMPELDGFEVLKRLQENSKICHIPVIFLTARYKDIDRIVKGLSLGAFDYITKPFEDDILIARVGVALRVKMAEDKLRVKSQEASEQNIKLVQFRNSITEFTKQLHVYGKDGKTSQLSFDGLTDDVQKMASTFLKIVSERSEVESKLNLREKELEQIVGNMVNAVITIDENGLVLSFNAAAEKTFGYSDREIIGTNLKVLMNENDSKKHDTYLQQYLKTGINKIINVGREVIARHKSGKLFPLHISIAELPTEKNDKRRFIGSCLDMTIQRKQEEQLRQTQKMEAMAVLSGGIAHDYNNMLGVISGFSELLAINIEDNSANASYVKQIRHAAQRGIKLTQKLLSVSKHKISESSVTNLNDILNDEQYLLEKTLTAKVKLEMNLQDDLWNVFVDTGDLEDCILNMTINAMHEMEKGGLFRITTSNAIVDSNTDRNTSVLSGEYVKLSLTDTGRGMERNTIHKIFDPFFSTKGAEGTGLGLSQVYGFVQRSNGSISVESEPGKGAGFTIYLPRCDEATVSVTEDTKQNDSSLGGNESILIVDDEPAYCEMLSETLSGQGYSVTTAAGGEEALEIINHTLPDLLLSDVILKGMDGYQLAEKVHQSLPELKIQLMSGFNKSTATSQFAKSLQNKLLKKPVANNELFERLRDLIES